MATHAAIVGVGMTEGTSPRSQTQSKAELCHQAVGRALRHAGLEVGQLDAIVFGTLDGFEATNIPGGYLGPSVGGAHGIPVLSLNTGGSTGGNCVNAAHAMVTSGDADIVVCVGPSSFDGVTDMQAVINTAIPLVIEQPMGVGAIHCGALFSAAYGDRYGATHEDYARIAVKNYENARHNPYAHLREELTVQEVVESRDVTTPLRFRTSCPVSSGASALIVASAEVAGRLPNPPVWIRAAGSGADTYLGGGRQDFARFENLALLAERIFRHAGVKNPRTEIDVAELFAPFAPFEYMELEALGIVGEGEALDYVRGGAIEFGGELPVNLSGGPLCSNPGVAAQLAPYGYAAWQLMGQAAGGLQVPDARRAVAHSAGGSFFQFHTLAVLERD